MVDKFEQWIEYMYGDPNIGKVKSVRGKFHEYLSMSLYYTTKVEVKIDMQKYVENMIDEFTINIEKYQAETSPETKKLFKADRINLLKKNQAGLFHTTVARGLLLCKKSRPCIQTTIAVLCTRVKPPNQGYLNKLLRLMKYLVGIQ